MKIYSGQCSMGDVGISTGETDMHENELFTGDIVQLWHGNYIGTDLEEWLPSSGLTAIVSDEDKLCGSENRVFTMGIADCGVQNHEWKVTLVKSHKDIIEGERFPCFGFNYRNQ